MLLPWKAGAGRIFDLMNESEDDEGMVTLCHVEMLWKNG